MVLTYLYTLKTLVPSKSTSMFVKSRVSIDPFALSVDVKLNLLLIVLSF